MKRIALSLVVFLLTATMASAWGGLRRRVHKLEAENAEQQLQIDQNALDVAAQQIQTDQNTQDNTNQQVEIDQNTMDIANLPVGGSMVIDTRHVQAFITVAAGFQNTAVATCPAGYVLTGCGFETSPGTDIFRSRQSLGFGTPDPALAVGRSCQATAQNNTAFTGQLFGNALCMRLILTP